MSLQPRAVEFVDRVPPVEDAPLEVPETRTRRPRKGSRRWPALEAISAVPAEEFRLVTEETTASPRNPSRPRAGWIANGTALLARIGADARDDEELRQKKALLVVLAILILPVSVVWGSLYLGFGSPVGVVPYVYFAVSLGSLVVFARTRRFEPLLVTQLLDILLTTTAGAVTAQRPFTLNWPAATPTPNTEAPKRSAVPLPNGPLTFPRAGQRCGAASAARPRLLSKRGEPDELPPAPRRLQREQVLLRRYGLEHDPRAEHKRGFRTGAPGSLR